MSNQSMVEVRGLVNRFGDQTVHDGLDLEVRRGEIFGIVGGSGSGKTVLLRSILGLHAPDEGEIRVLDKPPESFREQPQRSFGVVFQNSALFSALTVRENVEFPMRLHSDMPAETRRELSELKILMTGLEISASEKYPAQLSGGMRKRAALARALALEPRLLFLDEPTSGLDPVGATEFDELIEYLRDSFGLTVVMISHDVFSLFDTCDRIGALVNGKLVTGTVEEILETDDRWVQKYFNDPRARKARGAYDEP